MKNNMVVKNNELVDASYRLGVNAQRCLLACISQVDQRKPFPSDKVFYLSAKDFAKLYEIDERSAYAKLEEASNALKKKTIRVHKPDPKHPKLEYWDLNLTTRTEYYPSEGRIGIKFSPEVHPFLSQLSENFTQYRLVNISGLTSSYAIRVYELLCQWKSTGKREIEIDWLKDRLDLTVGSYLKMNDFKKRVLEPAITQINAHTNLWVNYTQRKTGRRVTHFTFHFVEKEKFAKPKTEKKLTKKQIKQEIALERSSLNSAIETYQSMIKLKTTPDNIKDMLLKSIKETQKQIENL